jgi:hypothetical protein
MNHLHTLRTAADRYLTQARDAGLPAADTGPLRAPVADLFNAIEAFEAARAAVHAEPFLNDAGKRDKIGKLEATAREVAARSAATARRRLEETRQRHEAKVQVPRVEGADLMAARHDLDRLTSSVKPGELADRLTFAARNGGDAVSDLLLGDNYAERVILPSRGPDYGVDAIRWADTKRQLIADRLGPDAAPHLRALDAMPTAAKAVTIVEHAAATTFPATSSPS